MVEPSVGICFELELSDGLDELDEVDVLDELDEVDEWDVLELDSEIVWSSLVSVRLLSSVCVVEVGVQTDSAPSTSHASPKAHPPLHRRSWADMVEQDSDSSEPMN